jgi:hypothetical protein
MLSNLHKAAKNPCLIIHSEPNVVILLAYENRIWIAYYRC